MPIPKGRLDRKGNIIVPCRKGPTATYRRAIDGNLVRAVDGMPLPLWPLRQLIRSFRGKYMPHVGAKQRAKMVASNL